MSYATQDLRSSFSNFRLWGLIAAKTIQIQHRRNMLGVVWLVFSFGIPALGIAFILSSLQGIPFDEHIPHVMFGFAGWYFLADCLTQGSRVITKNRGMVLQAPLGRSVFALSLVLERLLLLMVYLATAALVSSAFAWRPSIAIVFVPVSILIGAITGLGTVMFLSIVCARIRDLSELVSSLVRLSFFFTPIIWSASSGRFSPESTMAIIARYNPLTYFIDLLRMPMVGVWPTSTVLIVTSCIGLASMILGLIAIEKGGRSVAFFV